MKNKLTYLVGALALLLTSCADNVQYTLPSESPDIVGFWHGLWHGMIVTIAFIVSLFDPDVAIYAVYNNGGWYNFGFLLGISGIIRVSFKNNNRRER